MVARVVEVKALAETASEVAEVKVAAAAALDMEVAEGRVPAEMAQEVAELRAMAVVELDMEEVVGRAPETVVVVRTVGRQWRVARGNASGSPKRRI